MSDYLSQSIFIFDVILLTILSIIYSTIIFFVFLRRNYQPLKSRGAYLIIFSLCGNFLFTAFQLIVKIINNTYRLGGYPGD